MKNGCSSFLRRHGTSAADTHRVMLAWGRRPDLLDADLVAPGDVEVVLVGEALTHLKTEIGQADLVGVVGKAHPTRIGDAVAFAVDDEAVQMGVGPAEGDLDAGVQLGDGRRIGHQQPAPDQRADSVEPDAELVASSGVGRGHTAPRSIHAGGQGAVPSRERRGTSTTRGLYRNRVDWFSVVLPPV